MRMTALRQLGKRDARARSPEITGYAGNNTFDWSEIGPPVRYLTDHESKMSHGLPFHGLLVPAKVDLAL